MERTNRVMKRAHFAKWLALTALSLLYGGGQALAKENPQTGMAEVNGTRLYYEMMGKGPTIVLVHGGLVDSRLWNDQIKAFSKHQRVLRYDLRGFGRSAAAPEPFSHIEDLRALMDFLKIDRGTIVGLSLGGSSPRISRSNTPRGLSVSCWSGRACAVTNSRRIRTR